MNSQIEEALTQINLIAEGLRKVAQAQLLLAETGGGWTSVPVSPEGLAMLYAELYTSIEANAPDDLTDVESRTFTLVNLTLTSMVTDFLPTAVANIHAAAPTFLDGLTILKSLLSGYLGTRAMERGEFPAELIRRVQSARRDLDNLIPEKEEFRRQVTEIQKSYEAAESLPTTMSELTATLSEVRKVSSTSSELLGKIQQNETIVQRVMEELRAKAEESTELVNRASEAYRITTTVGLAAAFDERARSLNRSIYVWVAGLFIALSVLLIIGWYRLEAMKGLLIASQFDAARVWVQIILSVLSVGAPIWFGWISTKQISQRFRLAEDYAFKASVSKAYEGYRREASSLSPEFAQTLFASALTRLDEPPLRLLEMTTHGTPLHELASSSPLRTVFEKFAGKGTPKQTSEAQTEPGEEQPGKAN